MKLVRKDGRVRIVPIEQIEIPHVIKNRVDHTMTRWAISPTASKSWDFLNDNENEAPTGNKTEWSSEMRHSHYWLAVNSSFYCRLHFCFQLTVNSAEGHKIVSEGYIEIPHKTWISKPYWRWQRHPEDQILEFPWEQYHRLEIPQWNSSSLLEKSSVESVSTLCMYQVSNWP